MTQMDTFKRGRRAGIRASIRWLHVRADSMADPHAQAVLNSAAFSLGVDRVQAHHASDCAVHNEPAYPAGPCDCYVDAQVARVGKAIYAEYENRPLYAQGQMNVLLAEELARAAIAALNGESDGYPN